MRAIGYDNVFRGLARTVRVWGAALLVVAGVLWCCFLLRLATADIGEVSYCGGDVDSRCTDVDGLTTLLWLLGAAVPVSLTGLGLFLTGHISLRMSEHRQTMEELG